MKIIYLNAIVQLPTAEAEEKIQNATKKKDEPQINYASLGIRPPKGELETDEDGNVILDESDFEEVPVPVSIPLDYLGSWVASVDEGSTVYTKSNLSYDVIENIWEIDAMVEYLSMSWIERQFLLFKSFFARIKWKLSKENKQLEKQMENSLQD